MTKRAYLYFALTFILGVVVGSAGLAMLAWHAGYGRHHPGDSQHIVSFLKDRLGLSDQQVQQLQPLVDDFLRKERALRDQVDPQFKALHEDFRNRVRKILNSAQVEKFNELVRKFDQRTRRPAPPPDR